MRANCSYKSGKFKLKMIKKKAKLNYFSKGQVMTVNN